MRSTLNVCMVAGPHQLASCLKMQPDLLDKKNDGDVHDDDDDEVID